MHAAHSARCAAALCAAVAAQSEAVILAKNVKWTAWRHLANTNETLKLN